MRELFFFIGTEAELIKVFPVIIECRNKGASCHIIASGQNDIKNSVILQYTSCGMVELELSEESDIQKNAVGLLRWWIRTYSTATKKIKAAFQDIELRDTYMIVHGDTVSTYMGARIGRKLGMTVCHIEAGLRSHHLLSPFPEEIDRLLTSRIARLHFAPGNEAKNNLRNVKGRVWDTGNNTLMDSLNMAERIEACDSIKEILVRKEPYFVFVIHRQENVANEKLVRAAIDNLISISAKIRPIIILHTITKQALDRLGLIDKLKELENVTLLDRVDYFSFMRLLWNSEFVITDGGSNQEELYYMGKPTLIMRKRSERSEGIGENALLYSDVSDMITFSDNYRDYMRKTQIDEHPSEIIAEELTKHE